MNLLTRLFVFLGCRLSSIFCRWGERMPPFVIGVPMWVQRSGSSEPFLCLCWQKPCLIMLTAKPCNWMWGRESFGVIRCYDTGLFHQELGVACFRNPPSPKPRPKLPCISALSRGCYILPWGDYACTTYPK